MLTCGLVRSNFAFATGLSSWTSFACVVWTCVCPMTTFGRQGLVCGPRGNDPGESHFGGCAPTRGTPPPLRCSGSGTFPVAFAEPTAHPQPSNASSLARGLRDDLLRDVHRNLRVGVELHRVVRPALGPRPEVADVAEHLGQRN